MEWNELSREVLNDMEFLGSFGLTLNISQKNYLFTDFYPDWFSPINKDVWYIAMNGKKYNWFEYLYLIGQKY